MIDVEPFIEASFDRMLPEPAVPADWRDVLDRAGGRRTRSRAFAALGTTRRRYVVAALALLALVGVAGAAYAFGHPIIRFSSAPGTSSRTVVNFFTRQIDAFQAVLPHQARRITDVRIDGRDYPLFVAPIAGRGSIAGGGFCYLWKGATTGCGPMYTPPRLRPRFSNILGGQARPLPSRRQWVSIIGGAFPEAAARHVVLSYADWQKADIPFVWVTGPIKSGFFLYGIPRAHRRQGHQAIRISVTNASGAVIAGQEVLARYSNRSNRK
jgi:hypothetical protein